MSREADFIAWSPQSNYECMFISGEDKYSFDWYWHYDQNGIAVVCTHTDGNYVTSDEPEIILMEYIGRKDINGKKIYSDFIVQCDLGIKYKVVFSDEWCAFMLIENKTGRQVVIYPEMKLEVIGNIYENPELLEE